MEDMYASLRPAKAFICACLRPTEAACFRVRKCTNKRQLIVAGIYSTSRFWLTWTRKMLCALYTCKYTNSDWRIFLLRKVKCACVSYSYMRMRSISRTYIVYTPTVSVKTKFSCYCPLKGGCQKIFTSIFYNSNLSRPLILKVFTNSVWPRYLITKLNNFNFTVWMTPRSQNVMLSKSAFYTLNIFSKMCSPIKVFCWLSLKQ